MRCYACAARRLTEVRKTVMPEPIMMDVPREMETERLVMRPPQPGDGAAINAVVRESIAEVARWMPWANPTPEPEATERWCREAA